MANPHINYATFKSRFGDLGITEWTKYNYLSNYNFGLPAQTEVPTDKYLELEWIQSTGTQYIDLGVKGNEKSYVEIDAINKDIELGGNRLFGARTAANESDAMFFSTNIFQGVTQDYYQFGATGYNLRPASATRRMYNIGKDDVDPFETPDNLLLFNAYSQGTPSQGFWQVFNCKLYQAGELIRNLKPVKRLTDGAIGMYDTVTNSFFGNAGTGTFTAGPMKQRYVRVEYVESTGASRIDTGVVPNSNTTLELDFQYTAIGDNAINGLYNSDTDPIGQRVDIGTGNSSLWFLGAGGAITSIGPADTNRHKASVNTNTGVGVFDDVIYQAETQTFNTNRSIYLFARNSTGTAANFCKEKIYSSRIWKNGKLIRSFVPVYDLVNAEYGLYDLVEGKYYGTGGYGILEGPYTFEKFGDLTWNKSQLQDNTFYAIVSDYDRSKINDFYLIDMTHKYLWKGGTVGPVPLADLDYAVSAQIDPGSTTSAIFLKDKDLELANQVADHCFYLVLATK